MIDFIAKFLGSGNEFPTVLVIGVSYIVMLWFMFSVWVFIDAKKRYGSNLISFVFFIFVLIFNFPALIFYFLVRPENEGEFVVVSAEEYSNRGVNVPIANFIGEDGKIAFSFELKIKKESLVTEPHDMSVNVSLSPKVEASIIKDIPIKKDSTVEKQSKSNKLLNPLRSFFFKLKDGSKNQAKRIKSKVKLGASKIKLVGKKSTEPKVESVLADSQIKNDVPALETVKDNTSTESTLEVK